MPSCVNLQAFDKRFMQTCWILYLSAIIVFCGTLMLIFMLLLAAYISTTLTTSLTICLMSHRTGLILNVPLCIYALSSESFTLFSIRMAENFIISRCLRFVASFSVLNKKSVKLILVLSGVRISWETLALYIVVRMSWVSSCLSRVS